MVVRRLAGLKNGEVGQSGPIYLIGGANREGTSFGDVHRFDFDARIWTPVKVSSGNLHPRSGHSAVAIGAEIYVFGGIDAKEGEIYNDLHIFDTRTSSWREPTVKGDIPLPRNAHAAVALPETTNSADERQILVYGGSSPEYGAFADLFLLHIDTRDTTRSLRWEKINADGEVPEGRELHCALQQSDNVVCFAGGRNRDGKVCTDMALLDVHRWSWQLVPMCGWNRCSLAAGVVDGDLISFGGFDGGQICGDCCRYSDREESWLSVDVTESKGDQQAAEPAETASSGIAARFGHCATTVTMACELKEKRTWQGLLIFGGMNAERDLDDLVLISKRRQQECT
ncbi:hypothetical protein PHYBOEH_010715 [Phytophthora boehmeriae]|uniref:Attractin/MKLN-like beta-propeller domain-containing protein n=1 Tax=Phytophthora boehmeriae TaxID=109152 RepID=A0A8T1WYZ0_9STRA|nr:hypothetical protein PHYBOEH_010715 [Phytophthora boehmeriae]